MRTHGHSHDHDTVQLGAGVSEIDAKTESKRAARKAGENATSEEVYGSGDYDKFATPFEAAVASAYAKWRRPVTLTEVITEMTKMTDCKHKIDKHSKSQFAWRGFARGRWQISRLLAGKGQVPFPKGSARPSGRADPLKWRFSPSPAARCPLVELSCEPSPRSSAGCVVC